MDPCTHQLEQQLQRRPSPATIRQLGAAWNAVVDAQRVDGVDSVRFRAALMAMNSAMKRLDAELAAAAQ